MSLSLFLTSTNMFDAYIEALGNLNHLAVFVAAAAAMTLGFLWYSPLLFGKLWLKLNSFKKKSVEEKNMFALVLAGLVTSWITSYVLASLLHLSVTDLGDAVQVAFWLWLGFVATIMFGNVLWEQQRVELFILNSAFRLASLVLMAVILISWA
jgi:hypothetical protein